MAVLLVATAVTIGLAEMYSEAISLEARTRAPLDRRQLRLVAGESIAVIIGAAFPALFFVLAALGAFDVDLAFVLSKWSGLALICAYAFLAARLAGASVPRCLVHAAALGLLAGALIAVKSVLH
jgi:VIT1/CCC1 family predicted Fe2+/Mn2+ transporter